MNVNILDVYDFFYFTIIRNFLKLFFFKNFTYKVKNVTHLLVNDIYYFTLL